MALLEWEDSLAVGIDEIDEQHKSLFSMIQKLLGCIRDQNGTNFQELLEALNNYATVHFQTEEKYFRMTQYPHAEAHIEEHNRFRKAIQVYLEKLEKGEGLVKSQLLKFLVHWVKDHVETLDKQYVPHLRQHINLLRIKNYPI